MKNPTFRTICQYLGVSARMSVGAAILSAPAAYAGNLWIGGTVGAEQDWNNVANWGGAFPAGNATVNIGTGNFPILNAEPAFTPVDIIVGTAATGRFDQRAGTVATGNGNWIYVGQGAAGNGTYNLADTSVTTGPTIGALTGFGPGTGSINAGGPSTTGGRLVVGDAGTSVGVFNMNTSGTLKTEENAIGLILGNGGTSTGTFKLDAGTVQVNSTSNTGIAMLIGTNGGDGNFRMGGGTVNATGSIFVGDNNAGSQGLLEITGGTFNATCNGTGTQLGQHAIGRGLGQGTLNFSGGTLALTGTTHIGQTGTATAGTVGIMNVTGGAFTNTGDLKVGSGISGNAVIATGTGTLNISAGTANVSGILYAAAGNDNTDTLTGTINASGTGVLNAGNDVVLGYAGNTNLGKMTIADSAVVSIGTTAKRWLIMSRFDTAKGQLDINGGTLRLLNSTDIRFTTGNTGTNSTNVINQNAGAVSFFSDAAGLVPGGGVLDLQNSGAATCNNTYNLNGGTLTTAGVMSTLATATRTFNFNGGTLKPTGSSATFFNLGTGNSRANVRDNGAIIDTNGFDITVVQPLVASDVIGDTGIGGLTKNGTGKLTLNGANTYAGATTINAGTLELNGSATSAIAVNSGGTLSGTNGTTTGAVTFNAGSTLSAPTNSPLTSNGLSFAGPTNLVFNGVPDNGGQYVLFKYGAGGVTGLSNLSSTFRTVIADDPGNQQILGTVTTASINWNSTNGTWANGVGGWNGGSPSYFNGDTVTFGERSGPSTVTLNGVLLPAAVTVNNTTNPYTFTGTGSISGATLLSKDGAGALTIATANSYTGGTLMNAGTLNINNASALGTGTLFFTGGTLNNTSGADIVMTGNILQNWDADLTFTGTNSLDMGSGAVAIGGEGDNRTVTVSANTLAVGKITTGFRGLIKQGAGKLEVTSTGIGAGGSVIGGVLNVAAGTLQINRSNTNADGSGDFTSAGLIGSGTLTNGAAVERWYFTNQTEGTHNFTGVLANGNAGPLGFNKSGAGTQVLSGAAMTYTGTTTVGGGELKITGTNTGAGTPVVINSGKLTLASNQPLGTTSLIRPNGVDLSTLEFASDSDGTAYNLTMGTGSSIAIVSNRATSGPGINHTITTQALANGVGGGTINVTSGANVSTGSGRITFTQLGLGAGSVQTTTLNPTTANVTLGDVSKQNNNVSQVLGLGGTSSDNFVTGVISNGPALVAPNNVAVLKTNTSTWTLSGANTYTGTTTVSGGILNITNPVLADAAAVNLNTGGTLNLPYAGTDTVDRVIIDTVEQVAGTWGSLSSSAQHKTALITGTGILLATNGAPVGGFTSWSSSFGLDPLTTGAPGADAENDGFNNGIEYILGGSPVSGSNNPKIYSLTADTNADTQKELVVTIAVPVGTPAFAAGAPSTATFEGYLIEVRGSATLNGFPLTVTPVTPAVTTGLPAAPTQGGITYEYRSFSLDGSNGLPNKGFFQVRVTNP